MTEYTDIRNNTYTVIHTTLPSSQDKEYIKSRIVEELFKIFAKK